MKKYLLLIVALIVLNRTGGAYLNNLLVAVALFGIPALGLSLLMGYTGQISLGHAAFVGIGAYTSALLSLKLDTPIWLSTFAAIFLAGAIAWCIGWLVFRLKGHHLAMATLALGIIVHVVLVEWRDVTGGQDGLSGVPPISILGVELISDASFFPIAWLACIGCMLIAQNLIRSPAGLMMRVVSESDSVAESIGIANGSLKRQILMLSGAFAGLGGALYGHWIGYVGPGPFDVGFSIRLLLMVAIGGFSGTWSVLFGALFVVAVGEILKPLGRFDIVVYGLLLIIVMVYCPKGLLAGLRDSPRWLLGVVGKGRGV